MQGNGVPPAAETSTAQRAPGRPRSARAHQAILDATLELLGERGVDGMSVEAIAEQAGVSKATIYRRWSTKEELVVEAVGCASDEVHVAESDDPRADLVSLLRALLSRPADDDAVRLMGRLVSASADNPELARVWRERLIAPRRARLAALVRRAVDAGQLRPDADVELVCDLLIGPLSYRRVITGAPTPAKGLPEQIVTAVFDGLGPERPREDSR